MQNSVLRLAYLFSLLLTCALKDTVHARTIVREVISGTQRWLLTDSPFIINQTDLVIHEGASLSIDPGVQVFIGPGLAFKVKGIISARGSPDQRIVFTRIPTKTEQQNLLQGQIKVTQPKSLVRLVNGVEARQGQLQLWIANRWRFVCSRNTDWTTKDCRVVCRQLGFAEGNFTLGPRARNRTASIDLVAPNCHGNESEVTGSGTNGLLTCPGLQTNVTIGSTVCELQDLVGLNCWGVNEAMHGRNWKGLEIHNASLTEMRIPPKWGGSEGNTRINVSASSFEYVDILYAGVNQSMHHVAALSSSPYPPVLQHVRLAHNAYDAINFSLTRGPVILEDVMLESNMGNGASISSLLGYVRFNRVTSRDNAGSGARVQFISGSQYHWPDEAPELVHRAQWPCRPGAIPASPVFPFLVVVELPGPTFSDSGYCELRIESDQLQQVLTVTPLEVLQDPQASGQVDIWDVSTGEELAKWQFSNTTLEGSGRKYGARPGQTYQGVSSVKNKIRIRFQWTKPPGQAVCSQLFSCVRVVMQVTAGKTTVPEVSVTDSLFTDNLHYGLLIQNPWTFVRVQDTRFERNQYEAGLQVVNGSADVLVHNCSFSANQRTGLNVSTGGGAHWINQSSFTANYGHGLSVWNPSWADARQPHRPIETHVHTSRFIANQWDGIQFYNSCLPINLLVNFTTFENNGANGIRVYSCLNATSNATMTNFTVGFSHFTANQHSAIWIEPMVWMSGHVTNCTFTNHKHGVIRVDNSRDLVRAQLYRTLPVNYTVKNSEFRDNQGPNVLSLRLTEISELQEILVIYNKFVDNRIRLHLGSLNPRSSASAIIAVGSSNIRIQRNHLWNPESELEIASHLVASDRSIDVTENYWGGLAEWNASEWGVIYRGVYGRLFDQNHRYTLAPIIYHPMLKDPDLRSDYLTTNQPPYVPQFMEPPDPVTGHVRIGGRIAVERERQVELVALASAESYYHVMSDIFIPPGGILNVQPGARMRFENGLGLFSRGEVRLSGTGAMPIEMSLHMDPQVPQLPNYTWPLPGNDTHPPVDPLDFFQGQTVRLTGGFWIGDAYIGRLEVLSVVENISHDPYGMPNVHDLLKTQQETMGDQWGTVCSTGFNLHAAILSCASLGLVASPLDWLPPSDIRKRISENADHFVSTSEMPVSLANLDCFGHETNLFQCRHDLALEHSCSHEMDMVIKCFRPGWAGIRVTASDPGAKAPIRHLLVRDAGLLDFARAEFMPSVQLDYYAGTIEQLEITHSRSHGLAILHSHPLDGAVLRNSLISDNLDAGLLTRTPWLHLQGCRLERNSLGPGLLYDPIWSPSDMFQFHAGFVQTLTLFSVDKSNSEQVHHDLSQTDDGWTVWEERHQLHPSGMTFIDMAAGNAFEKTIYRAELVANDPHRLHQIILQLLDIPVATLPTSEHQARASPNATVGSMNPGKRMGILPASAPTLCNTIKCLPQSQMTTLEEVIIYDAPLESLVNPTRIYSWHIPRDLALLPLISSTSSITIELRVHGIRSGRLLLQAETRNLQSSMQPQSQEQKWRSPLRTHQEVFQFKSDSRVSIVPKLSVEDSVLRDNAGGIRMHYYNDPLDTMDCLFLRFATQVVQLRNVSLLDNRGLAIHVPSSSRFANDLFLPPHMKSVESNERLAHIAILLSESHLSRNQAGAILANHNHVQFANNIWSYQISDNEFSYNAISNLETIDDSEKEGLTFNLPIVSTRYDWRYQPFTSHRVNLTRNLFSRNGEFSLLIEGYLTHVELIENVFEANKCLDGRQGSITPKNKGLIRLEGMEKYGNVRGNRVMDNTDCSFVFRILSSSQAPIKDAVQAHVSRNVFRNNSCMTTRPLGRRDPNMCFTVGVIGSQNVTFRENIFENGKGILPDGTTTNEMMYEMVVSIKSVQIPNYLDARRNYWGTNVADEIRARIFQFDNMNSHSIVRFDEFFQTDQLLDPSGSDQVQSRSDEAFESGILGGVLVNNTRLVYRSTPYRVYSDLTVLPGSELQIDAGVRMEFAPHVGLLILGRLVARGFRHEPIRMGPLPLDTSQSDQRPNRQRRAGTGGTRAKSPRPHVVGSPEVRGRVSSTNVGLATEQIRLIGGETVNEGFIQFYNTSAKHWALGCDQQFSSEVAQVVCFELGRPSLNVLVRTSHLYDYRLYGQENVFSPKHGWMWSYACDGFEQHRSQCSSRLNFDNVNCLQRRAFIYIRCGSHEPPKTPNSDLSVGTWGGIRLVRPTSETATEKPSVEEEDVQQSILEHVLIDRAGLLHGRRMPAVSGVYAYPRISFVTISNCIADGFEFVSPRGSIDLTNTTIRGCLGRAVGFTLFNGYLNDPTLDGASGEQPYQLPTLAPKQGSLIPPPRPVLPEKPMGISPSELSRLPIDEYPFVTEQNVLGLISMCAAEKILYVRDRLLLHHQYSSSGSIACTKIMKSVVPGRRLAWRFLAVRLQDDPFAKNSLQFYNGADFNTTFLIAEVTSRELANQSRSVVDRYTWVTSPIHDILSVRFHGSPAPHQFGFVAEVITLPITPGRTYPEMDRPMHLSVDTCELTDNLGGGIHIQSVGDAGPRIYLAQLRLLHNGVRVLNLTGPAAIDIRVTHSAQFVIRDTYIYEHQGDVIRCRLYTNHVTHGTRYNVTNNVLVRNRLGSALLVEGTHYVTVQLIRNYIVHNDCGQRDLLRITGVIAYPFAYNFIHDNRASVILNCSGEEHLSQGSIFQYNGFYKNEAINYTRKTTVLVGSSKNTFQGNYFRNKANHYEMAVGNRSVIRTLPIQPESKCPGQDDTCPHGWVLRMDLDICLCYRPDAIDARYNWWGDTVSSSFSSNSTRLNRNPSFLVSAEQIAQSFARSRIYDADDDSYRIRVDFSHAYQSNTSVLGPGIQCPPTWAFHGYNCFYYFAVPMTYKEANHFCLTEVGAILATSRNRLTWLGEQLSLWQHNYAWLNRYVWATRAWIHSDVPMLDNCPVVRHGWLEPYPCELRIGFFCQKE